MNTCPPLSKHFSTTFEDILFKESLVKLLLKQFKIGIIWLKFQYYINICLPPTLVVYNSYQ